MGCVRWAVRCSRINKCPLELLPPESRAMAVSVTGLSPFCEVPGSIISSYSRSALILLPKMDSWKFLSLCSNYAGLLSDCDISVYLSPLLEKDHLFHLCAHPSPAMATVLGLLEHSGF